jgi:hypothetical protein
MSEDFVIKYDRGRYAVTLSSPKHDQIVQLIRSACAKLKQSKPTNQVSERVIRPSDVPGTLLNMALLNMGSEDPDLRLAAYNLLCLLSYIFNFDIGNQLMTAKGAGTTQRFCCLTLLGMLIPGNNTSFIVKISERLAATEPRLTLEFLKECFVGFEKSNTESKHLCLEYIAPWLSNLAVIRCLDNTDVIDVKKQTKEIIKKLMDLTAKEKEVVGYCQLLHVTVRRCIRQFSPRSGLLWATMTKSWNSSCIHLCNMLCNTASGRSNRRSLPILVSHWHLLTYIWSLVKS